ncbi:MAG: hypothetical protein WC794_03410 [Candidatus Doudnabacteria bacterium]|jgi:hypothetical protein
MKKYFYLSIFVLGAVFLPKAASADISIDFSNGGNATTTPGETIYITGTLTNNATSSIVYLNSLSNLNVIPSNTVATSSSGSVIIDEVATKNYLPVTLNVSQKYISTLIKVNVMSSAAAGDYLGMYTINAGSSATTNEFPQTQYFIIHIPGATYSSSSGNNSGGLQMGTDTTASSGGGLQMPVDLQFQDNLNLSAGMYSNGPRLIKLEGTSTVYWVNANNLKIPMWTDAVFKSYNNNSEEVQTVTQEEFDFYQNAKYVRLIGNSRIYKTEGKYKRFIPSAVWNPAGIDVSLIIDVNKTDFNSYKIGKSLTTGEELN